MDVELRTNTTNPALALRRLHRWVESPPVPAGWNALLVIRSGPFAAEREFYFDEFVLSEFIKDLRAMDRTLRGHAALQTPYEDPYVRLAMDRNGSVTVSGLLVEHTEVGQRFEFGFVTDQTILQPLVRDLELARDTLGRIAAPAT